MVTCQSFPKYVKKLLAISEGLLNPRIAEFPMVTFTLHATVIIQLQPYMQEVLRHRSRYRSVKHMATRLDGIRRLLWLATFACVVTYCPIRIFCRGCMAATSGKPGYSRTPCAFS